MYIIVELSISTNFWIPVFLLAGNFGNMVISIFFIDNKILPSAMFQEKFFLGNLKGTCPTGKILMIGLENDL